MPPGGCLTASDWRGGPVIRWTDGCVSARVSGAQITMFEDNNGTTELFEARTGTQHLTRNRQDALCNTAEVPRGYVLDEDDLERTTPQKVIRMFNDGELCSNCARLYGVDR